jgi:SAM-dependent methyltransferase
MPARPFDKEAEALAAIGADASDLCACRLARAAGIHALVLDGISLPQPEVAGVACWTRLRPDSVDGAWRGALRADADALPFDDEAFCAVLVRFAGAGVDPEAVAAELGRVLASHGTLLIAGLHPRSMWRAGVAPARWERALRRAGLDVTPAVRCGSPWPSARGAAGLPGWLVRGIGGAYVIEAHRRAVTAIPLRRSAARRRAVDHKAWLPGAHRKSLNELLRAAGAALCTHRSLRWPAAPRGHLRARASARGPGHPATRLGPAALGALPLLLGALRRWPRQRA